MGLKYVLQQVGLKVGLNPNDTSQRPILLRFANEAAIELYQMSDMAGSLEEQYFKINGDQTVGLPDYVGQIRAMRQADSAIAIKLSQMRPRYNQFNWQDNYRNWRLKGLQTLHTALTNQSALILTVAAVENPPIVVTISGSSDNSSNVSEDVIMNATQVLTANTYNDVSGLVKNKVNRYNIGLTDVDGNAISYIPNDRLIAKFQIVDVSAYPWFQLLTGNLLGWVEVLYKKALPWYSEDGQEFPAKGYDNVWVNKMLQLWYEEQNNVTIAISYYQKAQQSLAQIHEDTNRGTDDKVALVSNPHDCMNPRIGFGRDWQYSYRIVGR